MEIRRLLRDAFPETPFPELGGGGVDYGTVRGRPLAFGEVEACGEVGWGLRELVWREGDGDEGGVAVEGGVGGVFVEED